MTPAERRRWFRDTIERPARAKWGAGWGQLSENAQLDAIYAQAGVVLLGSGRLDRTVDQQGDIVQNGQAYLEFARMIEQCIQEYNARD